MPESTSAEAEGQLAFDEQTVDEPDLEEALEAREKVRAERAAVNLEYREKHEAAVELIAQLAIGEEGPVRVGRFRLTRKPVAGRDVYFTTEPTERRSAVCRSTKCRTANSRFR